MNRATSLALHRARCRDDQCPSCQNAAEDRAYDRDPSVDDWQTACDQYERYITREQLA